jgi:hypothetical protein
MPHVFISYSHDDDEHTKRVHSLAEQLRRDKIPIVIDADQGYGGPPIGWPVWSEKQVLEADRVVLVCTETYCRRYQQDEASGIGLGAVCEGRTIRQLLYAAGGNNSKFRAVVFVPEDQNHVPPGLRDYQRFALYTQNGYSELLGWLKPSAVSAGAAPPPATIHWPPLMSYEYTLADRKQEFSRFVEILAGRSERRILLLAGSTNCGKTVFLRELLTYAGRAGIPASLIDFKGCPSLDVLLKLMRSDLSDILRTPSSIGALVQPSELMFDFQQLTHPVLLVFDTYEQSSADAQRWLESQFLPRLDRSPGLVIVIAGQTIPAHKKYVWSRLADSCELRAIDKSDDWLEYSRRRWNCPALNSEHIKALTIATRGDPGQLSALLEVMVEGLQAETA